MEIFNLIQRGLSCRSFDSPIISDGKATLGLYGVKNLRGWFQKSRNSLVDVCLVIATDNIFLKAAAIVAGESCFSRIVVISDENRKIAYSQFSEFPIIALVDKLSDADVDKNIREVGASELTQFLISNPVGEVLKNDSFIGMGTKLYLTTSGTTGTPKFVEHNFFSLTKTTKKHRSSSVPVWGLVYPLERFAGLQVFLQVLLGGGLLISTSTQNDDVQTKLKLFTNNGVTHLSATPSTWRQLLMSAVPLDSLRQITLGGEIADQKLLDQLARVYPETRISHVYASTEAGASFSVTDKIAGFPRSFLENEVLGLKVVENELLIRAEASAARPLAYASGEGAFAVDGWIHTGDNVEIRGDRVHFLGRLSGVINVGGTKIYPEEIESVVLELIGVSSVRVYPKPNPILGSVVALEIVPTDQLNEKEKIALIAQIKQHCKIKLSAAKRPMSLKIVEKIELMSSGKLKR